jgi:uroporphyrinogen III methyltransferase/synthase
MTKNGMVYLVGAGPGDAGLLTLRGAALLGRADVVVYDALVNPELLRHTSKSAEIIFAGKRARDHSMPQAELNHLLIEKARSGKVVVRLKGGDPYVFGRGAEEAAELSAAGVPFEVVPGISSFVAVPNYAGIPLTHRDLCSRITLITGHGNPAQENESIDWAHLATTPGTRVVMMGTERVGQIAQTLMSHGASPETPIAMVQWGTTGRQKSVSGTLANIAELAKEAQISPPTVTVIGDVVKMRANLDWFEDRPLFGKRFVVTRSREQAGGLSARLAELGGDVLEVPTIKYAEPTERGPLVDALLELNSYDWLVFTSPNGVTTFFDYFFRQFHDMRDIGGARIAAVGPATAKKLQELHLQVDLMPAEALGAAIAREFQKFESIENLKICLLRAEAANPDLPKALEELGAIVDDIPVYRTVPEAEDPYGTARRLSEEGADWILFTSGSTVEHFHQRFALPELMKKFPSVRIGTIGPETSKALRALKIEPTVEARQHTLDGLLNAVLGEFKN